MPEPVRPIEQWVLAKPPKVSDRGIVVAQHWRAAEAGTEILAQGGNAVDAAVATALALGVVEPWMSGIGGSGLLVYGEAKTGQVRVVDFTLVSPAATDPKRYPLAGGLSNELFGWPMVADDRNAKGYESICIPGSVAGLALALERFGRKSFAEVIEPAARLAEQGLPVDWHSSLNVSLCAAELREFPGSRAVYLPNDLPPVPPPADTVRYLPLKALARSYRRLQKAGPRDFYEGELARAIVADLSAGGSAISARDLADYRAQVVEPQRLDYRGVTINAAPLLTGGSTLLKAMAILAKRIPGATVGYPDAGVFLAYAEALRDAFAERLETLGHAMPALTNTTHLSVVDREGNMVALTNTLLSRFGSKVVLPETGIPMNNGMMWFDPTPGRVNSIAPGKKPLANMCPALLVRKGKPWVALGACGGRRIIPAVAQLTSFLVDFEMSLAQAFETPRLDASTAAVLCDIRMAPEIVAALAERFPVERVESAVFPAGFAMASAVMRQTTTGRNTGMTHIASPAAAAVVEP
jgi:gamma-glutamyltranspeptidase/glutathione hydrolase